MSFVSQYPEVEPTLEEVQALAGPVLLEFGAPWCGYCQGVQKTVEKLLGEFPAVKHIKVYDGRGKPLGRSFRVKLWPNFVFLKDGALRGQLARPSEDEILKGLQGVTGL